MNEETRSRTAGIARTVIALVVLLVFLGGVGYNFWPELMPRLLSATQSVRGIGAEEVESRYFDVRTNSDISASQVRGVLKTLESDYEALLEFLGRSPGEPIPVLITNGSGPAMSDGDRLNVFFDSGVVDLGTAPFFLVFFIEGQQLGSGTNLFLAAGLAIYVTEETGRAQNLIGQPADAWVELLRQRDALLPLSVAWETDLPEDQAGMYDLMRGLAESGSFTRWLVEGFGMEAVRDLSDGLSLENVTGMSLTEAEQAWLTSVAAQDLRPKSCTLALYGGVFDPSFCEQLDETTR